MLYDQRFLILGLGGKDEQRRKRRKIFVKGDWQKKNIFGKWKYFLRLEKKKTEKKGGKYYIVSHPHQKYVFWRLPKYPARRNSIWTWDYGLITDVFPTRSYYGRITYTEKINFQVEVTEAMSKALRTSGQSDNPFSPGRPDSNTFLVVSTRYCVLLLRDSMWNDGNYNDGNHNDEEDDHLHK